LAVAGDAGPGEGGGRWDPAGTQPPCVLRIQVDTGGGPTGGRFGTGRVVASGTPRKVLTPQLPAEVFGVRAAVTGHPLTGDPLIAFDHREPLPADGG